MARRKMNAWLVLSLIGGGLGVVWGCMVFAYRLRREWRLLKKTWRKIDTLLKRRNRLIPEQTVAVEKARLEILESPFGTAFDPLFEAEKNLVVEGDDEVSALTNRIAFALYNFSDLCILYNSFRVGLLGYIISRFGNYPVITLSLS